MRFYQIKMFGHVFFIRLGRGMQFQIVKQTMCIEPYEGFGKALWCKVGAIGYIKITKDYK